MTVKAYGAYAGDKPLEPIDITRRAPGAHDVQIDIAYCGVCHSDLHQVRAEWAGTQFPCVPGHEIVGRVSAVGAHVSGFKPGDLVGIGCIVDSCKHCDDCAEGLENYCDEMVGTYNGPTPDASGHTLGGYSQQIVAHECYVLRIRHDESQLAAVAPLLCAGITTYSPLRHWNAGPGKKVGVVGIGGLGHMGVKLAHAMGAHVVAFTTSESKRDGTMALVGAPASPHPSPEVFNFILKRRSLAGSAIGGIPETQEMLDFCAEHNIVADIELIRAAGINDAYERMLRGDVKYRFVIDNASLAA
ncbi:NAD(P)-dependent alcohol dehydrogenase [Pseudomonas sp. S75]|uniref:NAD(P)-dependent alcohol dehydrogenase n=1 Tax=unclassified Pseudomonas TaxID=196821 RepID=UPI001907B2A1|nr:MULTISPECIES: NAD(P)-dependent alcohol dehydrogenase [unclassified Pseudomonas]MBJ9974160.1 NAD(P)-dependent alcohol dehydrogenase [Pseudomonas sp. S30]MBK0151910.1 NAD(P)-dependent alcohol dehydrogenase [Pseudomonas sp. S75]